MDTTVNKSNHVTRCSGQRAEVSVHLSVSQFKIFFITSL